MVGRKSVDAVRLVFSLICLLLCAQIPEARAAKGEEPKKEFAKKEAVALAERSIVTLRKAQDILRFASVKLPGLTADNLKYKKLDREMENCREETYPGINSAEKLKSDPQNLREVVRLYVGLRVLEERLMLMSDHLFALENAAGAPLANQLMDLAYKVGQLAYQTHPYVYKVIDAYQGAAPPNKVEGNLGWVDEETQGPGI